jgi:hypothetical protein
MAEYQIGSNGELHESLDENSTIQVDTAYEGRVDVVPAASTQAFTSNQIETPANTSGMISQGDAGTDNFSFYFTKGTRYIWINTTDADVRVVQR